MQIRIEFQQNRKSATRVIANKLTIFMWPPPAIVNLAVSRLWPISDILFVRAPGDAGKL